MESEPVKPRHPSDDAARKVGDEPAGNGGDQSKPAQKQASISEQAFVDRIKKSDRWMILLTVALVFTSLLQWSEMRGQLDVMRAQQRPWVEITDAQPVQVVNNDGTLNVAISVTLKNLGATPATGIDIEGALNVVSGETMGSIERDQASVCAKATNYRGRNIGMSLAPGEVRTIGFEPTMLVSGVKSAAPELGVTRPGGAFAVYGCADYIIDSRVPHGQTYFRYIVSRKRPPSHIPYMIYLDEGNLTSEQLFAQRDDFQGNYSK